MTLSVRPFLVQSICFLWMFSFSGCNVATTSKDGLSYCGLTESSSRLIFVSTLDGKITALNPNNEGAVVWAIHPGSESMLSSSIHKLELSNYGHLVRMIPSLDGGLYKFNGENIELIPVTSDHLLQSSLKYSDDLVISGGKETHTFGVSLKTGNTVYECSMKSCGNISHSTDGGEILVIQRKAQTVRAVEPRTGTERWNFSVAQHELKLISECHSFQNEDMKYRLQIIIPEGVIYATDVKNPDNILWKQKLESPITNAWQLHQGKLIQVDLFNGQVSAIKSPSLYIGMYDKQLYIQESVSMLKRRNAVTLKSNQNVIVNENIYPVIPWKPVPATNIMYGLTWEQEEGAQNALDDASQRQTTALSVLYASPYVDGNGFFLYSEDDLGKIGSCNSSEDENAEQPVADLSSQSNLVEFSEVNTPVEIVVVSFWYYWKEVLVISVTTALLCNLMITRTYMRWKYKNLSVLSESNTSKSETVVPEKGSGTDAHLEEIDNVAKVHSIQEYTSRYLMDFEPVACLGKGGFGVVFEAKNKIDDCHYAIKRILLPRRQESRERVLREVKALAKLDHHNIVRYFNAWTECPPSGWQEKEDKSWFNMNSDWLSSNEVSVNQFSIISSTPRTSAQSSRLKTLDSNNSLLNSQTFESNIDFYSESGLLKNEVQNDISDSFVVFSEEQEDSPTKETNETKLEDIITVNYETEGAVGVRSTFNSSINRPIKVDQGVGIGSQNLNKVYLYIQMQLCQRNSLRDWLRVNKNRDYEYVSHIFEQILQAVEHVHLHGLIHRDLKPSNIFFSLDNQIKIGDFGLVTAMTEGDGQSPAIDNIQVGVQNERHTAQVGTQLYMSPEQLSGKPYNYKVDIYSLGLILFELLVPFGTQMERIKILQNIKKDIFPEAFQETYIREYTLLRLMLSNSPEERPTTYGIRARLSLKQDPVEENWHFELPVHKCSSSKITSSAHCHEEPVFS